MKKIIVCLVLLLAGNSMIAQNEKSAPTLEISLATFQTNALSFDRNYVSDFQNDLFSSNTLGYSLSGRLTQQILLKNLNWFVGARTGLHAYSLDLSITEAFRYLGWGSGYTSLNKEYTLFFANVFTGLRYDFPIGERMKIGVEYAVGATYHLRSSVGYGESAMLDNGQVKELFDANISINAANKIMFSPQFGLSYQYNLKNGGLRLGTYIFSGKGKVLEGTYQLFGDAETLEGSFTKDYSSGTLELGYFWNL
jgi:hypothetical protein